MGTGIYFAGVKNGLISSCIVTNIRSVHGNGLSVYQQSENVTIESCFVRDVAGTMLTFENTKDLTLQNNLFDAAGTDSRINEWGGMSGYVRVLNNTFVNNSAHSMLLIGLTPTASYSLINNIIDGGGPDAKQLNTTRQNNIYLGFAWYQHSMYGWTMNSDELYEPTLSNIFISAQTGNWMLQPKSKARAFGKNLNTFGIATDITGSQRQTTVRWDAGAYNFSSGFSVPATPQRIRLQ
jgi:hypothetical protein